MAVPVVTTITPSAGLTGGKVLVRINGANFRAATLPPSPTTIGPTVAVLFGTKPSPHVMAVTSSLLWAMVPVGDVGQVTVIVRNLADDGSTITGETVSVAHGYTYQAPDLTQTSALEYVTRMLLKDMGRQILANISLTVHVDYDSKPSTTSHLGEIAKLPALVLTGPMLVEDRFYSSNQNEQGDVGTTQWAQKRPTTTVSLQFTITGAADSTVELLNLQALVSQYLRRNPWLEIPSDSTDPTSPVVKLEMGVPSWTDQPSTRESPNESNVRQFTAAVILRGVDVDETDMVMLRGGKLVDYIPPGAVPEEGRPAIIMNTVSK